MPVWRLVPLPHNRAAALCAPTLLPNWTLDETNKFVICATSRGSVLTPKKPKACENVLFLCLFWRLVPLPHDCAAALCASTLLPNWTLDIANKFAVCATSRGPFFRYKN